MTKKTFGVLRMNFALLEARYNELHFFNCLSVLKIISNNNVNEILIMLSNVCSVIRLLVTWAYLINHNLSHFFGYRSINYHCVGRKCEKSIPKAFLMVWWSYNCYFIITTSYFYFLALYVLLVSQCPYIFLSLKVKI